MKSMRHGNGFMELPRSAGGKAGFEGHLLDTM